MSLLRILAVICIGIALIPSDKAQQERLQQTAIDMAYWTITFCERNAYTCRIAQLSWIEFKQKAQFAMDVGHEVLMQHIFSKKLSIAEENLNSDKNKRSVKVGTLQTMDMAPEWHQKTSPKDVKLGLSLPSQ